MKDELLKEITKDFKLREKIVIFLFYKDFVKIYNKIRIEIINLLL